MGEYESVCLFLFPTTEASQECIQQREHCHSWRGEIGMTDTCREEVKVPQKARTCYKADFLAPKTQFNTWSNRGLSQQVYMNLHVLDIQNQNPLLIPCEKLLHCSASHVQIKKNKMIQQ